MAVELNEVVAKTIKDAARQLRGRAKTMTWQGVRPVVRLLDRVYRTGVRLMEAVLRL